MSAMDAFNSVDRMLAEAREKSAIEVRCLNDRITKLELERDLLKEQLLTAQASEQYWQRQATQFTTEFATVETVIISVLSKVRKAAENIQASEDANRDFVANDTGEVKTRVDMNSLADAIASDIANVNVGEITSDNVEIHDNSLPFAPGFTAETDVSIATEDCPACHAPAGTLHAPGCAYLMSLPMFTARHEPPTLMKREPKD